MAYLPNIWGDCFLVGSLMGAQLGTDRPHLPYMMDIPSGKLTWQFKMDPLKMYFLLKIWIFHCYVSLPEGRCINIPYHGCHGSFIFHPPFKFHEYRYPNLDAIFLKPDIYIYFRESATCGIYYNYLLNFWKGL